MKKYIVKRLLWLIPIFLGITFLSFAVMRLAGGDVVQQMAENSGITLSEETLEAQREALGLDQPFLVQYLTWLGGFVTGNLGKSYVSGQEVFPAFLSRLPATLLLAVTSVALTVVISIPLGILAAVRQNRAADHLIRLVSFIGNSLPNFFVALLLMYLLAVRFPVFPVISTGTGWKSLVLPALTLAIAMSAKYLRQIRAAVLEELGKDFVTGARARGIPFSVTLRKSVLRSCLTTILTLLSLSIGSLLGGTAIVESVFMWDGVGKLAVDAIRMRDYPVIQAYVVWMAVIYVTVNLITDLSYRLLDPRIRLGGDAG